MSESPDRPGVIPPTMLAQLLEEQRRHWHAGERVLVEAFLMRLPTLRTDPAIILDLIYNEFILREQFGERPKPDEYFRRFPKLRQDLALQFEVDRFLEGPNLIAGANLPAQPIAGRPFPALAGYQIHGTLGRGGMGVVYRAKQLASRRILAVKLVLAEVRPGSAAVERFRTDAEAIARLNHRHVASALEIGARDNRLYAVSELLEGNLAKHVAGTLQPPLQTARWLETLARTVHVAHKLGVVHGALKPTNVLLSAKGIVKIGDFGIANLVAHDGAARLTQMILGTPNYLAPEQTEDAPMPLAPTVDVYSMGAILYELLTGRPPFQGLTIAEALEQIRQAEPTPPTVLQPNVPADLEAICLQCLRKNPKQRYATAEGLAQDLVLFMRNMPVGARHASIGRRVARWTGGWLNSKSSPAPSSADRPQLLAQRRIERLHLQLDLARRLIRLASIDGLLRRLAEGVVWLVGAESATVFVLDRERRELWSKVTQGKGTAEIRQPVGVGIAGTVAANGQPIVIADAALDPRFNLAVERHLGPGTRSLLAIPLPSPHGEWLGVVQVVNKFDGVFDEDDLAILSGYAASAAVAVEQALAAV